MNPKLYFTLKWSQKFLQHRGQDRNFIRLALYALQNVHSNAERQEKFLSGLDDEPTNQLIFGD